MGEHLTVSRRALVKAAFAGAALAATPLAPVRAATRYRALEALLERYVAERKVPGAIVAIVKPGRFRPDYVATGLTDWANGGPVRPDTIFRIFSMTKPVTGMATLQQVERGRLGLDMAIAELMPEFRQMQVLTEPDVSLAARPAKRPIRVRHLLTHTAGLSYHIAGDGPLEREYRRLGLLASGGSGQLGRQPADGAVPDLAEFARRVASLPLRFEPGSQWHYSIGLDVAGALLERATGTPLDRVFEAQLFGPLGMADTRFQLNPAMQRRLSALYAWLDPKTMRETDTPTRVDGPEKSDWATPPPLLAGGAGLVSSARDYARFAQMLLNEGLFEGRRVMAPGTVRAAIGNLLEPGVFFRQGKELPPQGYGAGGSTTLFDTRANLPFGTPAGVYGWGGAAGTLFHVDPVRRYGVVLMVQHLPAQRYPLGRELNEAVNREAAAGLV
ncbi:serine hydrolase domain-containing protein [Thermaurantiacus sp.]